ncbi:hypothetical protein P4V41_07745 [Fictibacillus nanhaiensis]|uniref:hypothetical protein n=1 Tax=Fictibacillus nanhaiensis TaxID=742169 RepID=UPI002E21E332|nr:hypothetical protein [Fictibacillus nanhaiensis]
MKKSVKYTAVGLTVLALFGTGTFVGANTDWKSKVINDSYSGFLDTASDKTDELTSDVSGDINEKVQSEISGTVDKQHEELERLLDEYYKLKLAGYTNSEEYKQLEQQIITIRTNVYESYKKRIDEAFVGK